MKSPIISARLMAAQAQEEQERDELVERIARRIVERRLETPAVLFLEFHKPLAFLASQAALVTAPFLGLFFAPGEVEWAARLLGSAEAVEQLIRRIEQMSDVHDVAQPPSAVRTGGGACPTSIDEAGT